MNWLRLHVSNVCNFKCPNCHVFEMSENVQPSQLMSQDIFISSIKSVIAFLAHKNDFNLTISLYGGETLANKALIKKVILQQKSLFDNRFNFQWIVNTNGSLLTEEDAAFFKEYNVEIHLSVDGKEQIHNLSRPLQNGSPTFHLVTKALNLIQKYHLRAQLNSYVTPLNQNNLKDIIDIAAIYSIKRLYLDQFYSEEMNFSIEQVDRYIEVYLYSLLKNVKLTGPWTRVKNNYDNRFLRKQEMNNQLVLDVNVNGSFYSSQIPALKYQPLPHENLFSFLNNDYTNLILKSIKYFENDCQNCELFDSCFGIAKEQVWYHINQQCQTSSNCNFYIHWLNYLNRPVYYFQLESLNIISIYPQNEIQILIDNLKDHISYFEKKLWPLNKKLTLNVVGNFNELLYGSKQMNLPIWVKATTSDSIIFHLQTKPCHGLKHEVAHLFLNQLNLNFPSWAIEGICEWLSGNENKCIVKEKLPLKELENSFNLDSLQTPPEHNPLHQNAKSFFLFLEAKYSADKMCQLLQSDSKLDLNQWLLNLTDLDLKANYQIYTQYVI